jgi:putative methionine-R-sulfoxide reductase with GAF domain
MSSFPLPDNSSVTSSPEKLRRNVEHSTPQFSAITTSRRKESVGPEPELQAILEQAMDGTGATGAVIALSTEDALCCRASTGASAPEVGVRLHAGISLTGLCLRTGEILLCNDTYTDRRVDPQLCKETGIRSVLIVPIKQNGKVAGVLEVLSTNPNAFNQHDATAMSMLADRVIPLPSESATIPDRCLDKLPSKDIEAARELQKFLACADVLFKEYNNRLPTTDAAEAAEAPECNRHYIGSQLPDQPVTMTIQEHPSGTRWLTAGLATALALVICGYGYHLNHPSAATNVAILPIAAANHKPAIPEPQHMLSEQDQKTNGQPKAPDSVLTGTRQEPIRAIQEAVQGTDVNRVLNRADAGDSTAQYEMALRYADGEGVPQNYRDAMAWFAKAAANGNDNAQWRLGLGYIEGIGVPHDERKAVVWFKRAANHGNIRAQNALSDLYLSGRGVPRDFVRAYTWANIATGLREDDNYRLRVIGSRMTEAQIEDAHRRISSWRERQTLKAAPPVSSQRIAMPDVSDK